MRKIFFLTLYLTLATRLLAQQPTRKMTFFIIINDDFPDTYMVNKIFVIKDSVGHIQNTIPFEYEVGDLIMKPSDYQTLFKVKSGYKLSVKFSVRNFNPDTMRAYEIFIPKTYVNDKYMILRIYDADYKDNNKRFYFEKGQRYITQVIIAAYRTLIPNLKN